MGDDELQPIGSTRAGDEGAPPPRPRRARRLMAPGLAVVVVVSLAVAVVRRDPGPDARERLDGVLAFLARSEPVRFDLGYEASQGDGSSPKVVGSSRIRGRIDGAGGAVWTETSGVGWEPHPYVEEAVLANHGVYRRTAEDTGRVAVRPWLYTPRADFDRDLERRRERSSTFFDSASDSPLFGDLVTGDLGRVVGHLDSPRMIDADTLRASRPVADLFAGATRSTGTIEVELTAATGGRPTRLVLTHKIGRDRDHDRAMTLRWSITDLRLHRWAAPAEIPTVAVEDVDGTPRIDEEAFARSSFAPILAPTDLPPGMLLTMARIDAPFECAGAVFKYVGPGGSELFLKQWFCPPESSGERWTDEDGVEQPFPAGAFPGAIRRASPSGRAVIRVLAAGSFLHAESNLDDDALRATFASLAPVDFATQPVELSLPPA